MVRSRLHLHQSVLLFQHISENREKSARLRAICEKGIPFIDVGMGLNRKRGSLNGMLLTTYYSAEQGQKVREKGFAEVAENLNDYTGPTFRSVSLTPSTRAWLSLGSSSFAAFTSKRFPTSIC